MDDQRFDNLLRALHDGVGSRRRALTALLAGLSLPLIPAPDTDAKRGTGKRKGKGKHAKQPRNEHQGTGANKAKGKPKHKKGKHRHRQSTTETLCRSDADCTLFRQPICLMGMCHGCFVDANCVRAGKGAICCPDGICTANSEDCVPPTTTTTRPPPLCRSDANCPNQNPICLFGLCRPCGATSQCVEAGKGQHCCPDGTCSASACPGVEPCQFDPDCTNPTRPICDQLIGACLPCAFADQCVEARKGQRCCRDGSCTDTTCPPAGPCRSSAECTDEERPICDQSTGTCLPCRTRAQCLQAGKGIFCCADGACTFSDCVPPPTTTTTTLPPGQCRSGADCTNPTRPICEEGRCRPCIVVAQCIQSGKGRVCCPDGACAVLACPGAVRCQSATECTDPRQPICDALSGTCQGCRTDTQCGRAGKGRVCCPDGTCASENCGEP